MSIVSIRAALETALAAISPSVATAYENQDFTPPNADTAYQRAYLLPARPENQENNAGFMAKGFLQVSLFYPLKAGTGVAAARAELVRSTFYRGLSLTSGAVTINISETPEIMAGSVDGDRFMIPVRIPWHVHII